MSFLVEREGPGGRPAACGRATPLLNREPAVLKALDLHTPPVDSAPIDQRVPDQSHIAGVEARSGAVIAADTEPRVSIRTHLLCQMPCGYICRDASVHKLLRRYPVTAQLGEMHRVDLRHSDVDRVIRIAIHRAGVEAALDLQNGRECPRIDRVVLRGSSYAASSALCRNVLANRHLAIVRHLGRRPRRPQHRNGNHLLGQSSAANPCFAQECRGR